MNSSKLKEMILPLYTPVTSGSLKDQIILAADIGATKTNLAIYEIHSGDFIPVKEKKYPSTQFQKVTDMLDDFLSDQDHPDAFSLGVAGPVINGRSELTNIHLVIDAKEISEHFNGTPVYILNDLESTAYGLGALSSDEMLVLTSHRNNEGNAVIIAPGTGLGEAGLYFDGTRYHPFATEGGHCDFAPRNESDIELLKHLSGKFGHVSWERLVSGPGIMNIYQFLRDVQKMQEPEWLKQNLESSQYSPEIISSNHDKADICSLTMELFIRYLAIESSNLVLKHKGTGGLFIGGGIIPDITHLLTKYNFESSFCDSDRMNKLLSSVPLSIIMNSKAALIGAAFYGAHQLQ